MMFSYKDKIIERITKYAKDECKLLNKDKFILGDSYYNYKCHLNAIQYAKKGLGDKILVCICIDENNFTYLHFINVDSNGNYVDNTLGWVYESVDYYLYTTIPIEKIKYQQDIEDYFTSFRRELVDKHSNKFLRKLLSIKYDII